MMVAQRWLIEVECTVGADDYYYDVHREGGRELMIGLKCTRIEIECMRREELPVCETCVSMLLTLETCV